MRGVNAWCAACIASSPLAVGAATLPAHDPLDILVVSDEVNPNNLTAAQLTQPGDISEAINAADSGVRLVGGVAMEVSSQCVDDALARLESTSGPDVVIYFAHRGARSCAGEDVQAALTEGIRQHLTRGGGFVVFHHGVYQDPAKRALLQLIGVESTSIGWNTTEGQRVINVAPGHFVTTNGVTYEDKTELAGFQGIAAGEYESFVNRPDERYPATRLIEDANATRELLFVSDSGGTRVLGYALSRSDWQGKIVVYQPGEYQPNALDDRAGNNFQILANAILFSTGRVDATGQPAGPTSHGGAAGGSGAAGAPGASGSASTGGLAGSNGGAAPLGGSSADNVAGSSAGTSGSSGGSASAAPSSGGSGGETTGGTSAADSGAAGTGSATGSSGAESNTAGSSPLLSPPNANASSGCGLTRGRGSSSVVLAPVALLLMGSRALRGRFRRRRMLRVPSHPPR